MLSFGAITEPKKYSCAQVKEIDELMTHLGGFSRVSQVSQQVFCQLAGNRSRVFDSVQLKGR